MMPFSFTCMALEEDLGCHHLQQRTNLNQHQETLHLLRVLSLVKSSPMANRQLQKESLSLKIGCCPLFQAIPLPNIGEEVLPHWSKVTRRVISSKESLGLLEKDLLEKVFSPINCTIITGWLERAHDFISEPNRWRTFYTLCTFLTVRAPA
uniref:Uncharacterized protein n=1 Tax=Micrurus paraensis TaxID=1970185 RepID=A0A2D4KPM7_9SAUR